MARIADWEATATIKNGKILAVTPCFQSGPFDEHRRDRVIERTANACRFQLFTSRKQAYEEKPTKSILLRIAGEPGDELEVKLTKPVKMTFRKTLGELAEHSEVELTGPFTAESVLMHRLVMPDLYNVHFRHSDYGRQGQIDYYYVRVTQANGQQAWSSPFWVEG